MQYRQIEIVNFFVVGVNYKKTDATRRSLFAVGEEQYSNILSDAEKIGLTDLFVLSTCNRTEIYGFAENASLLTNLICEHTEGGAELFNEIAYIKKGEEAMQHLFQVGAGLDSQILGDYEIIGQLKNAFRIAKEQQTIDTFLERLFNTVLQSSKSIKNNTELSSGTISVSFAAIKYILGNIEEAHSKNILLVGTGKIGVNTCKNILDYIHPKNLWVMNRTNEKAQSLSTQINVAFKPYQDLETSVNDADVIIVATNSKEFIIKENSINKNKIRHFIDMSIPNNIDPAILYTQNQHLVNVDDLSKINDITLSIRKAQIPRASEIITEHFTEFYDWHQLRKYAPVLKSLKENLNAIHEQAFPDKSVKPELVAKIVNKVAANIRTNNHPTCFYMQAVQDFIDQPIFN